MPLAPKSFLYESDSHTGVATIMLNRPDRLNALTFDVYRELRDAFRALDTEPGVRAVIITGAGREFGGGVGRHPRRQGDVRFREERADGGRVRHGQTNLGWRFALNAS